MRTITKGLHKKFLFGVGITTATKSEILEYIEKYLDRQTSKPLVVATPNPEQIVLAQRDSRFAKILNRADIAIPDGTGVARAIRCKKIAGVKLMEDLIAMAARRGFPIALIGGRDGVAVEALECLSRLRSGLAGWAEETGELNYNNYKHYNYYNLYKKIQKTHTSLVFVGLGAPKQEYFIARLASQDTLLRTQESVLPLVFMSVGGSFDEISGRVPRAPAVIDRLGFKWLWRLVHEPWRWKRQIALIEFGLLVLKEKFRDG